MPFVDDSILSMLQLYLADVTSCFLKYDRVWFHSHRKNVTFRIYALTDEQLDSLLHFLERGPESDSTQQGQCLECPLPILGDDNNLTRVDPDVAIPMHNIFRDRWERKIMYGSYNEYAFTRGKGIPRNELDYPEIKQRMAEIRKRREGDPERQTLGDLFREYKNRKGGGSQSGP